MSGKGFENELARALARPDVDQLRHVVTVYHEWSNREHRRDDDYPDELDIWFNDDDVDRSLALIMLALEAYDEVRFLGVVSAGLLEDVLSHNPACSGEPLSADILDRVVAEAQRTPRFRWLLSGIWTNEDMNPNHVAAIENAVGSVRMDKDPIPPRPWA